MENWWYQWQISKMKNNEILNEVRNERLVQQYRKNNKKRIRGAVLLCELGGMFIRAGTYLHEHFDTNTLAEQK